MNMTILNVFKPSTLATNSRKRCGADDEQLAYAQPRYDIADETEAYLVSVDLPGVAKQDISITLRDGLLEVIGKRSRETPKGWKALGEEKQAYAYRLRLMVDDRVQENKISADSKNGVLRLTLPKEEEAKPRKIAIN